MEYVKDYMKLTKIGGVYTKDVDGWKLLTRDKELMDLVNETKPDHELHLYVDTVIDKKVEPSVQMQPWVIIRPRKNLIQVAETPELEEGTVSPKGTARRKLNLQGDKISGKSTGKNDIVVKLPKQPSQGLNKYELLKMKRLIENRAKFDELGLGKYGTNPTPPIVQNVKGKEKDNEISDEYVLENERESDSDDSPKCGNFESGSPAAYIALRERQMQNLEVDPMIEDVGELSLQNAQEVVEKVHGRSANEKPVIKFSKQGQPIGDRKIISESSNFLGTLVKDHVSLTHVNWHVVPQELKKNMVQYTLDRFDIPAQGKKYLNKTLNTLWRVHKSHVKKAHYSNYDSDEKLIQNRPHEIPLEDFKVLLKYWADEEVQVLAQENASRRNSYTDPYTLGHKTLAEVKEKLKTKDPNQASLLQAKVYFKSRKHKKGRKYKTNRDAIQKRMDSIDEMLKEGNDADVMLPSGKHGRDWLVGRQAVCFHRNKLGHWKRNCKVYLAELKKKKGSKTTASDSGMFMIEFNMSLGQISTWVLDTACSSHICNSLQGLKGSRTLEKDEVILRMGNGARVAAIYVGSFSLHMSTGKTIILNNCYYVPSIVRNIVSIPMLDVDDFSFIIKNNECSILRDNVLFGRGILNNGLLGHISENRLWTLHKERLLDPFDFESYPTCESCLLGKMTKSPFSGHGERAADLIGLVHTDVCGPMSTQAMGGFSYFITFIDDRSRFGYVYLMKHKSEAFEKFKEYKLEVEKQTKHSIITLRSDRGGEYLNGEFLDYLKENGIVSQWTPPYTPQLNGVSERRN
ncbi:hypothetical protein AgCh_022435 [Apium graveolens]